MTCKQRLQQGFWLETTRREATKYHLLLLQVFCLANNRMSIEGWMQAKAAFLGQVELQKKKNQLERKKEEKRY